MSTLIAGLVLFFAVHSVRIVADDARAAAVARIGVGPYRAVHGALTLVALYLIVQGFAAARLAPTLVWTPPLLLVRLAPLLVLVAFVLAAAAFVPGTRLKARFHHPFVLGVKAWAFAHLIATGTLAHLVLFGSFLAWAVADYVSLQRRDRRMGIVYPPGRLSRDAVALVVGLAAWLVVGLWLHPRVIGVNPFV